MIEWIRAEGEAIALLIRAAYRPAGTEFFTPERYKQQVGFVVHPARSVVPAHRHRNTERHLTGMSELLIVREGRCLVDLYDDAERLIRTLDIGKGDLLLLVGGGHGVRVLDDAVILEVKQGPFAGPGDKILLHNTP